jgi:prepilin-type N-terminal cleavage/methylation domain-containing protein
MGEMTATIGKKKGLEKGFTLIEVLICLSLFFIIIISSLEFFLTIKNHFFKLKKDQEMDISVFAALDKMRIDFQDGGLGLLIPQELGVISGIELDGDRITTRRKDIDLALANGLVSGSTRISLHSTTGLKKGQKLCVHDRQKGETVQILSADKEGVVLTSPIKFSYDQQKAEVLSVKTVCFYLDQKKRILRRKVNTSPAQPLLEKVEAAEFKYDDTSNLINVHLKMAEERTYERTVFPKNLKLATPDGKD